MSFTERLEWELPHLHEAHQVPPFTGDFWSVKFYPYTEAGVDPVFAVVGGKNILIFRTPRPGVKSNAPGLIQAILDEESEADNYACAWAKVPSTGAPLLCVGGTNATIKVINIANGCLYKTLTGHGGDINDLAVSPINSLILASGSVDSSIRIWSLEPEHKEQPCVAILAGDGHRETIYTVAFHANGRYLLSGGMDHVINLWTLPDFCDSSKTLDKPVKIHYPLFSSSEVHGDIVDCIAFHGDLILSRSTNEDCIVLWSITGFSSKHNPPPYSSAPTTHDSQSDTRSCFAPPAAPGSAPSQYSRLMQFKVPDSGYLFMRFSLFPGSATTNPVLAMGNLTSKIYFWDLERFKAYADYISELSAIENSQPSSNSGSKKSQSGPKRPAFLTPFNHRNRVSISAYAAQSYTPAASKDTFSRVQDTSLDPSSDLRTGPSNANKVGKEIDREKADMEKSLRNWARRYDTGDPLVDVEPHKEEVVKMLTFLVRQVAWSGDGEWCVAVGSAGTIAVLGREKRS